MSRSPHEDPRLEAGLEQRIEVEASTLRESTRPMPESLRERLLAIPADSAVLAGDATADIDRLYGIALSAAASDHNAGRAPDLDGVPTTSIRAAVVELLAAVFRQARVPRPLPKRLADVLLAVRQATRPQWMTRWITEPRWAAAACWILAFALTLGTGDAVAGLLDAPSTLHTRSVHWAQRADDLVEGAWDQACTELSSGYDLVRSRTVAAGARAQARGERLIRELDRTWAYLSTPTFSTPNEPLPQEAQNDR